MSATPQTNPDNQEIDFSHISRRIGDKFEDFSTWIFKGFLFIKKNIILLIILFLVGAGLGIYVDRSNKVYDHQIIVSPNFGSTEYLYSKIDLLAAKITEGDSAFLIKAGIKDSKKLSNISIKPITDVYKFIENKPENFELLKLMAEDGDINKIVVDEVTSKNYPLHMISYTTNSITDESKTVEPILAYLNDSDYFKAIQKIYLQNLHLKYSSNDTIINQIDGILNEFSANKSGEGKSDKLVYYNENTQLNDVINTKNELVKDKANIQIEFLNADHIVKKKSSVINIKNTESINGKMKFVFPFVFISLFIIFGLVRAYYRHQMLKYNK